MWCRTAFVLGDLICLLGIACNTSQESGNKPQWDAVHENDAMDCASSDVQVDRELDRGESDIEVEDREDEGDAVEHEKDSEMIEIGCGGGEGEGEGEWLFAEQDDTSCADGLDNDCDGMTDCMDDSCWRFDSWACEGECEGEALDVPVEPCQTGPINPQSRLSERWILICPGRFVMGPPGPECSFPHCVCGIDPGQCKDRRCGQLGCPGEESGVRAGSYVDETPQHLVDLTVPFVIHASEVTQSQWYDIFGTYPSYFKQCGPDCPVEGILWSDAVAYCNEVSIREGRMPCYLNSTGSFYTSDDALLQSEPSWPDGEKCEGYRLPTEAEWEYAARAGSNTAFPNGGFSPLQGEADDLCFSDPIWDLSAWFCANSGVDYRPCVPTKDGGACGGTHEVGSKRPNEWGIFDMAGNVREWVWDMYHDYPDCTVMNPKGFSQARGELGIRVARGGYFADPPAFLRSAARYVSFGGRDEFIGFRPVRSLVP